MLDFIAVPFGYVMRFIYEGVGSYGLSIILFTLLTQIILLPFNWKQKKGMMDVQRIQPKMLELQKKYANNREKYAQEVQKLYDEEGVSPLSGCLPMLLTLPIMMGLYYVVAQPLRYFMGLSTEEIAKMAELLNIEGQSTIQMQAQVVAQYFDNFDLLSQHFDGHQSGVDPVFQGIQHFVGCAHFVGRYRLFAKLCHAPDAEASGGGAGCFGQCLRRHDECDDAGYVHLFRLYPSRRSGGLLDLP